MNNTYSFGYPRQCTECSMLSSKAIALRVAPYYKAGNNQRVMLIGQDPTIYKQPYRVTEVLMLNDPQSQLLRWLKTIFGEINYHQLTLYATNLVKCSFSEPPTISERGGLTFLKPYFKNCKVHLAKELLSFKPNLVLTLGEPTHKLFINELENRHSIPDTMKTAFTGQLFKAKSDGFEFDYTPCLHIKTFRVAETYGDSIRSFKQSISTYLKQG